MMETDLSSRPSAHPIVFVILLLVTVGAGFIVIGPLIGFLVSIPFYPGSFMDMTNALTNPMGHPEMKVPMYVMQGCATLIGLVVGPFLLMMGVQRSFRKIFDSENWQVQGFMITAILVVTFMGLNSFFVEWNANVHFPSFMKGFEDWARATEDQAAEMTKYMTQFNGVGDLMIALVVIAVLPALGEEIVFRGLLQSELQRLTRNGHVAIILSAILFSAIHMQFFGFIPRFLLGVLFGYLFYWSGNLWLSILAHFVNNGVAVVGMYFYQQGAVEFDMESTESLPLSTVLISGLMTALLLYYLYKLYHNRDQPQAI